MARLRARGSRRRTARQPKHVALPHSAGNGLSYWLTEDPKPGYQDTVFPVLLVKLTPSEEMLLRVFALAFAE